MSPGDHNLPVDDESITTIDEWREAIADYLGRMYGMRLLCETNVHGGVRFVQLKETLPGSSSTLAMRKAEAVDLGLIEPELKNSNDGYGTHTYYTPTGVGARYIIELEKRGIPEAHHRLKPLEQQIESTRSSIKKHGLSLSKDPLEQFSSDHE